VVHVAGQVRHPDVYTLPAAARVADAVRIAGGARPDADLDAVNLAAHIQDGEQIYIPSQKLIDTTTMGLKPSPAHGSLPGAPAPPGRIALAGPLTAVKHSLSGQGKERGTSSKSEKLTDPSQGMVDLNNAGEEDLERLPGVGPSTAARILEFRSTNGKFTSIEDLMNVKGIGPAKFAKMKPFLTAGK
jgi:competence protein ComEA